MKVKRILLIFLLPVAVMALAESHTIEYKSFEVDTLTDDWCPPLPLKEERAHTKEDKPLVVDTGLYPVPTEFEDGDETNRDSDSYTGFTIDTQDDDDGEDETSVDTWGIY